MLYIDGYEYTAPTYMCERCLGYDFGDCWCAIKNGWTRTYEVPEPASTTEPQPDCAHQRHAAHRGSER